MSTYHELNNAFVPRVPGPPTPLEFLQYVRRNQPVVFTGLMEGWGALERWDDMYLREKMQGCNIDVAVTPLGFVPLVMVPYLYHFQSHIVTVVSSRLNSGESKKINLGMRIQS